MGQHGRSIALRPSQIAMFYGGGGRDGVTVFSGQVGVGEFMNLSEETETNGKSESVGDLISCPSLLNSCIKVI